jgi:hypothetical protein
VLKQYKLPRLDGSKI